MGLSTYPEIGKKDVFFARCFPTFEHYPLKNFQCTSDI